MNRGTPGYGPGDANHGRGSWQEYVETERAALADRGGSPSDADLEEDEDVTSNAIPRKIARFLSLLLAALSSGVFFGTKTSLGRSTKGFSPETYVEVQQATVRNLRPVMGALLPGAVAANLVEVVLSGRDRRSPAFALTLAGLISQIASLAITGLFELPINARVMTWSPEDPPEGWEVSRDRWDAFHTARTATSVFGLGCLVAAALAPPTPPRATRAERQRAESGTSLRRLILP